jgi:hypothetical protein
MRRLVASFALAAALAACKGDPPPPPADEAPTPAIAPTTPARGDRPGRLELALLGVAAGRHLTDAPPWHAPGGDWEALELETPGGVWLVVARREEARLDEPDRLALVDARLGVRSADDARRLIAELGGPRSGGAAGDARPALAAFGEVLLADAPGGSRARWTLERGAAKAQLTFAWSTADRTAELAGASPAELGLLADALLR